MNPQDFGPFAAVVGLALALVATFAYLVPRIVGRIQDWAWLADNPPTFLSLVPARMGAVVVMAIAYLTINQRNYWIFAGLAAVCALLGVLSVFRFDRERRVHVASITEVGPDGQALRGRDGAPQLRRVVVGTEAQLRPEVAEHLRDARRRRGGLSAINFMAGYGNPVNTPANLWDETLLASIGSRLNRWLTGIVLFGVLALYLAALVLAVRLPAI